MPIHFQLNSSTVLKALFSSSQNELTCYKVLWTIFHKQGSQLIGPCVCVSSKTRRGLFFLPTFTRFSLGPLCANAIIYISIVNADHMCANDFAHIKNITSTYTWNLDIPCCITLFVLLCLHYYEWLTQQHQQRLLVLDKLYWYCVLVMYVRKPNDLQNFSDFTQASWLAFYPSRLFFLSLLRMKNRNIRFVWDSGFGCLTIKWYYACFCALCQVVVCVKRKKTARFIARVNKKTYVFLQTLQLSTIFFTFALWVNS